MVNIRMDGRCQLSPKNYTLFKEIAGELLIRMGYETGTNG
jgi:hypothetical protein